MKLLNVVLMAMSILCLTACRADVCPEGSVTYFEDSSPLPLETDIPVIEKVKMQIGQKMIEFDRVIHGPICNDSWEGTVYVACDVQLKKWQDKPKFLEDCNLTVGPDTVVFVAAHNNSPYYKGCVECH